VLDPFCGSGTTGVAALRHSAHLVGIDWNGSQSPVRTSKNFEVYA
jgi:tRNA G10  N-methylase Trm11